MRKNQEQLADHGNQPELEGLLPALGKHSHL